MYLALDLSGSTGWAMWSHNAGYSSGTFKVEGGSLGDYALAYARWIAPKLDGVTECWIEDIFLGKDTGSLTIYKLAGLRFETAKACQHRRVRCRTVGIGEWRKHFIGVGAAPKDIPQKKKSDWLKKRAIEVCKSRGWAPKTTDEADALGILDFMRSALDPTFGAESTPLFRSM